MRLLDNQPRKLRQIIQTDHRLVVQVAPPIAASMTCTIAAGIGLSIPVEYGWCRRSAAVSKKMSGTIWRRHSFPKLSLTPFFTAAVRVGFIFPGEKDPALDDQQNPQRKLRRAPASNFQCLAPHRDVGAIRGDDRKCEHGQASLWIESSERGASDGSG